MPTSAAARRRRQIGWLIAFLSPFLAIGAELVLMPYWLEPRVLLPLSAAIFLASWFGGLWTGIWATAVTTPVAWYLFVHPEGGHQLVPMALFLAMGLAFSIMHERMRRGEQRLRDSFELGSDGVFLANLAGNYIDVNRAGCEMLGFTRPEILRMNIRDLVPESELDLLRQELGKMAVGATSVKEWKLRRRDGTFVDVEISAKVLPGGRLQAFVRDITARREADTQLRQAAIVFENTSEAVMVCDHQNRLVTVNRAFTAITGYQSSEVVGQNPRVLQSGRHDRSFYQQLWGSLQEVGYWQGEIWNRRKDGEVYPAWENISVVRDTDGRITHYVSVLSDISSIKLAEERLAHLAHHDVLTGLPNRLLFMDTLEKAVGRAKRQEASLALLFLDLDRFKRINDTMGHTAGDELLKQVGQRLEKTVRSADTLARLGGDEFVIALEGIQRSEDVVHLAQKIIAAVNAPIALEGRDVVVGVSIGIAMYPHDACTVGDLMRAADSAMYRAKERGRATYEFYAPELTAQAVERLTVEHELRRALTMHELVLHYQPQIDLRTGQIAGVEALVRWNHPTRGLIMPDRFIPVAEESALMTQIGNWVIEQSLGQARAWLDEGRKPPRISINVSGRQIQHDHLVETMESNRRALHLGAKEAPIELELTESVLQTMEHSAGVLRALRSMGVRIAIDDFGTGYSSLSLLKHLPIDTLKIDHLFVRNIPDDAFSRAIASAIISMSHTLGLRVIAEGVETDGQVRFLRERGCDEVQGYLFGAAMSGHDVGLLLDRMPAQGAAVAPPAV
jgi:diguanylate cyclase (GGDEF)-like protein/PAS domain S-box-containing protein